MPQSRVLNNIQIIVHVEMLVWGEILFANLLFIVVG